MSDVANEQQDVKTRLDKVSKETGTCTSFKVFSLGSNGTVYASCGLHEFHEKEGEDESIYYHLASQRFDDGSVVTFKWSL